jgi:AcrR family transcriptional regulator
MTPAIQTRELILNSAEALVLRDGAGSLTLERVAREASISKGGVLYHFATKAQLIQGLVERLIRHFDRDLDQCLEKPATGPGRRTRAFVHATLEGTWDKTSGSRSRGLEIFAVLLAALTTTPKSLAPLQKRYARWQRQMEHDGLEPVRATVVRLATDGLWLCELLGFTSLSQKRRAAVVQEILRLASECEQKSARKAGRT